MEEVQYSYNTPHSSYHPTVHHRRIWIVFAVLIIILAVLAYILLTTGSNSNNNRLSVWGNEQETLAQPTTYVFDHSKIKCPEYCVLEDGNYKPKITSLSASYDSSKFLSSEFVWREKVHTGWKENPILVKKVNEITKGLTNSEDKVFAIANWVHKSKNYDYEADVATCTIGECPSHANNEEEVIDIYNANKGVVCMDAAVLSTAMLRIAGIPSVPMIIGFNHIITLYNINGKWYGVDTTFCADKNDCDDVVLESKELNAFKYFNDHKGINLDKYRNLYCDSSDICFPFGHYSLKILPFEDDFQGSELFFPSFTFLNYGKGEEFKQYRCRLEAANLLYGSEGYTPDLGRYAVDNWRSILDPVSLQYYDTSGIPITDGSTDKFSNFGYSYVRLPANQKFRYICTRNYPHPDKMILSKEIVLETNSINIISSKDLVMSNEADVEEFNQLKSAIEESLEGINIEEIVNRVTSSSH